MRRSVKTLVLLSVCLPLLVGCLSSGPPAPPVQWLDPTARFAASSEGAAHPPMGLRAQPHLGQEVAVRTDDATVVYDPDHRWLVPPEEIVRRAFGWARVPLIGANAGLQVELQTFELRQVPGAAAARVVCVVTRGGDQLAPGERVEVVMPAADASRGALTDAMGQAVQELVARVLAVGKQR